jgi:Ca2+-binding RTX toxin-like protein
MSIPLQSFALLPTSPAEYHDEANAEAIKAKALEIKTKAQYEETKVKLTSKRGTGSSDVIAANHVSCFGLVTTIDGTANNDVITGTSGPDVINGLEGDDIIKGLGGDDVICGGPGNDIIYGDAGNDVLFGDYIVDYETDNYDANAITGGHDKLYGGGGEDSLVGDYIETGPGNDKVTGGNDELYGGYGNDFMFGDFIYGGDGNDNITGGNDKLNGGAGEDSMVGDYIYGNIESNPLAGGHYTDTLRGGDDILRGGAHDDFLFGDHVYGDDGDDEVIGGNDKLYGDDGNDTLFGDNLYGDDGGDEATGNDIEIIGGNDMIKGGNDELYGGYGNDYLFGDDIYADDGFVVITGGDDTVIGGDDKLFGDSGNDFLFGDDIESEMGDDTIEGGNDVLNGGAGKDNLFGDSIFGGLGNDILYGGHDKLYGNDGNDFLFADNIGGGDGNDGITGGNDQLYGNKGDDNLFGEDIAGGNGDDGLADGNDKLVGGPGTDVLLGDNMTGDGGIDIAKLGTDTLTNDGIDTLIDNSVTAETIIAAASVNPTFENRTIDGTGNNIQDITWGSTGITLMRVSGSAYSDGISTPAGASRISPRAISNIVVAQDTPILNSAEASDFIWQWGQLLDHDMDLTPPANPAEPFNIPVPTGDLFFDPTSTGTKIIPLKRSLYDASSNPREQINILTAFIDASNVYGSDPDRSSELRTFSGGKLKTSKGDFLPFNKAQYPNAGNTSPNLFLAGDERANEQFVLTSMHTLFVREHNRLAEEIAVKYPGMSDEKIYQMARKIVGAEMQIITYNEFLPFLLGQNAIPSYQGYDPQTNPGIANEFSSASFRYGHSQLSPNILRIKNSGDTVLVPLRNAFSNPSLVTIDDGIDSTLRGLAGQKAQEVDNKIVDDVRNFLFGPPGSGGFDLASLNIQRGRDHGLPDYNSVRVAYGLAAVTSFAEISSDPDVQNALSSAYSNVNDIDLWVGGLAEDHVPGALVGETIRAVLADQFTRLRDGDRFWYQNDPFFVYYNDILQELENTKLSDIIRRNTSISNELQDNVFITN